MVGNTMDSTAQVCDPGSIDEEYNPRLRVPNVADIFARWTARAADARKARRVALDVRYGPSSVETLDFFPAARVDAPLLVFIHGGYWRAFDKADFSWVAPAHVDAGAAVAVVNYGLAPATPIEEIVREVQRALAWLYADAEQLAFDRERIVCAGHSAGGHLTAMMMTTSWPRLDARLPRRLLAGTVAVSGLFDLRPLVDAEFLKSDLRLDLDRARLLSPAFRAPVCEGPCVVAVGALESSEFHRQARLLQESWGEPRVRGIVEVPGTDHFSVCEAFAAPGNALFETTCELLHRGAAAAG